MNTHNPLRIIHLNDSKLSDLICFSHLRWDFVYQRPQHLMSRFSNVYRVFFIEEPVFDSDKSFLQIEKVSENLWRVIPHLKPGFSEPEYISEQQLLLKQLFTDFKILNYLFWYYTPMALPLGESFEPQMIAYDCMDELSNFKFAPPALRKEKRLFEKADIVFTGGYNLYNAKKNSHHNIYPFPSSIDKEHFAKARNKWSGA